MKKQPDYKKSLRDPYDVSSLSNIRDATTTSSSSGYSRDPYSLDPKTSQPQQWKLRTKVGGRK